jgi:hypothetical protein
MSTTRCDFCNSPMRGECPSCLAYNASVAAQQAAAKEIALAYDANAKDAYLNQYGVFARVKGIMRQVGSKEIAAPFVALTGAAREVKFPEGHCLEAEPTEA